MLSPLLLALVLGPTADANSSGKTGASTTGCTSCHGSSADSNVSGTFSASATEVGPGDTVTVTFTVASSDSNHTAAGLNVSADDGTLAAGSNTQESGGEITHSSATALSSGTVDFSFDWTAPSSEGTVTLSGAANAVNGDGGTSGDGWALATDLEITVVCTDDDGDGSFCDDCDDSNANAYPGAAANEPSLCTVDADGDGWGDATAASPLDAGSDCDDASDTVYPGAPETCDLVDQDCDGNVDNDPIDGTLYYEDSDGDGYGSPSSFESACSLPSGYVEDNTDCDDSLATVSPGATEVCDASDVDEDCNGFADDADAGVTGTVDWYVDDDGDGYGSVVVGGQACDPPSGGADNDSDCDDTRVEVYPGAAEDCDATEDLNCDGFIGLGDNDGDGFSACEECDDGNADVNPGATELCNGIDDNCDEVIDPDDSADASTWYPDADYDGYGDPDGETTTACEQPGGYTDNTEDCDDTSAGVHPDAIEVFYDGIDQDCDGNDDDQDGDGVAYPDDCDDTDASKSAAADCAEPEDTGADDGGVDTAEGDGDGDGNGGGEDESGCGGDKAVGFFGLAALLGLAGRRRREEA